MRVEMWRRPILCGMVVLASCVLAEPVSAGQIPSDVSTLVNEFRSFISDFQRWDTAHNDLPLMALALTPDQQRPEMLLLLWELWMHDSLDNSSGTLNLPRVNNLAQTTPNNVANLPGNNTGNGSVSSLPTTPSNGGDGSNGASRGTPEPASLTLFACGSVGFLAYRLVRTRVYRGRAAWTKTASDS